MKRLIDIQENDRITCPRCNGLMVGQQQVTLAATLITCARQPRDRTRKYCSQKVYVIPMPAGLCAVVMLTDDEFAAIRRQDRTAREVLRDLGVLAGAVYGASHLQPTG